MTVKWNQKRQFYRWALEKEKSITCSIHEAFPFLVQNGHVVSFVGAGGKTTLIKACAEYVASIGKKVLVTTTTHIAFPNESVYASDRMEVQKLWEKNRYAVIGNKESQNGTIKLIMPERSFLETAMREAELVLIEADGAKRYPCKVPAAHEPVILPESDIVVGVIGMHALGNPVEKAGFRLSDMMDFLRENRKLTRQETEETELIKSRFTTADFAAILSSEHGTRKDVTAGRMRAYYVCMNQCDDADMRVKCDKIARLLTKQEITKIIMTGEE